MTPEQLERKRANDRARYAANPERAKQRSRERYAANRDELKAKQAAWRAANPNYTRHYFIKKK